MATNPRYQVWISQETSGSQVWRTQLLLCCYQQKNQTSKFSSLKNQTPSSQVWSSQQTKSPSPVLASSCCALTSYQTCVCAATKPVPAELYQQNTQICVSPQPKPPSSACWALPATNQLKPPTKPVYRLYNPVTLLSYRATCCPASNRTAVAAAHNCSTQLLPQQEISAQQLHQIPLQELLPYQYPGLLPYKQPAYIKPFCCRCCLQESFPAAAPS